MDKKLIKQYGEDILCYRLRTARQKMRMQYEDFDKRLIQLYKEESALYRQQRNLGWELLVPPVQKRWKRFFVLRDDVARSRNAEFFQNILNKINTYDWSHRKDFMIKKRRFGRKKYVVKEQKLLQPCERHFEKLEFNNREKQMFHEEFHYEKWSRSPVKKFVFNEPWRFVLKVRPNMITRIRRIDSELESRIKEIGSYMERNNYEGRLDRLLRGAHKWKEWKWKGYGRFDETDPFPNKSLHQILDLIKE